MIKLKDLLFEYKSWIPVVTGIITPDGEIQSHLDDEDDHASHFELGYHYGTKWRYNPKTQIVYWPSSNRSGDTQDDRYSVENHLHKKYKFKVKDHLDMNFKGGHEYINAAHGITKESINTTKFIPPSQSENRNGRFWWLSPEGKFYSVEGQAHNAWARNYLINDLHKSPEEVDSYKNSPIGNLDNSPYHKLISDGWMRIGIYEDDDLGTYEKEKVVEYDYKRGMNPLSSQIKRIKDLGIEKGAKWIKRDRDKKTLPIDEKLNENYNDSVLEKKNPTTLNQYRTRY
jgi:hypothetical protein